MSTERWIEFTCEDGYFRRVKPDGTAHMFIDSEGTERWYDDQGKLHREDGPAYVSETKYDDGSIIRFEKAWYQHGQQHREDGPATEWENGQFEYVVNDLMHRTDGPARYVDGEYEWFINGKEVDPIVAFLNSTSEKG